MLREKNYQGRIIYAHNGKYSLQQISLLQLSTLRFFLFSFIFSIILLISATQVNAKSYPTHQRPSTDKTPKFVIAQKTPFDPDAVGSYCAMQSAISKIHEQAEALLGATPSDSLQPSTTFTMEQEGAIFFQRNTPEGFEESLQALSQIKRIPIGSKVQILKRLQDDAGRLIYHVSLLDFDVQGFIRPVSIAHWYNLNERFFAHLEKLERYTKPKIDALIAGFEQSHKVRYIDFVVNAADIGEIRFCAQPDN